MRLERIIGIIVVVMMVLILAKACSDTVKREECREQFETKEDITDCYYLKGVENKYGH